jgi:hypothetical protein
MRKYAILYSDSKLTLQDPVITLCTKRINMQKLCFLPTQCVFVFYVDLKNSNDYFLAQH